jgi:TonB family protein
LTPSARPGYSLAMRAILGAATAISLVAGCGSTHCARGGDATAPRLSIASTASATANAPEGAGEARAAVDHDIELGELVIEARAPSPPTPTLEPLTPERIGRIAEGQIADLRHCYESALAAAPALSGRVVVLLHIHASGNVVSAEVAESTIEDPAVGACIAEHVDDWHFPEAPHEVAVRVPFVLRRASTAPTATVDAGAPTT